MISYFMVCLSLLILLLVNILSRFMFINQISSGMSDRDMILSSFDLFMDILLFIIIIISCV